jgi:nitrogenase molybdenum-cofactor synthesis protein NifE
MADAVKVNQIDTLEERQDFILKDSKNKNKDLKCDQDSIAGSVSQRACVYCGARVVLNPITDALHLVHGPIGCASYTWDIRGSLTSDAEVYRNSFSTDVREKDIIFGGEKKLSKAIDELVEEYSPKLIFVYSTCVIGVIGDDLEAVCREAEEKHGIRAIPVQSSGFAGNKKSGYKAGCNALLSLMRPQIEEDIPKTVINYFGDFNLAGEMWIIEKYLNEIGVTINAKFTGDATVDDVYNAPNASLTIVQCAGSMMYTAKKMKDKYGIPFMRVSFFGLDDIATSLRDIAAFTEDPEVMEKAEILIERERMAIESELQVYRDRVKGKSVAIYVGGGFKGISLIKQFNELGMKTVMVGTQTGSQEEYDRIRELADEGTVVLDDANPSELEKFMKEKGADLLVGGVKERPLAYKLGIAFVDHNHERKHPLAGYVGALNFAKEVDISLNSPVWNYVKNEQGI